MAGDANATEPFWTGTMWECPNLLDFGEKRTLIISMQATPTDHLYAAYFTGRYADGQLFPELQNVLVYGGYFYAPQVMRAADGRYIMWGWIKEGRSQRQALQAGWAGVMSLPISLSLLDDGRLALEPVEELNALRQEHLHFDDLEITPINSLIEGIQGAALEVLMELQPDVQTGAGITLHLSPDGHDPTRVIYQPEKKQLVIERSNPNLEVDTGTQVALLSLAPGEPLNLRIFLDHSVLAVFANRSTCITTRIYPAGEDSNHLGLTAQESTVKLKSLDIWKLKDIWR